MFEQAFHLIIELSLSASIMIVIMIGLRVCLQKKRPLIKQSAFVIVGLLILLRACLPLHVDWIWCEGQFTPTQTVYNTVFSHVLPEVASVANAWLALEQDTSTVSAANPIFNSGDSDGTLSGAADSGDIPWFRWLAGCWFIGMAALLAVTLLVYGQSKRRVKRLPDLEALVPQLTPIIASLRERHGIKRSIRIKLGSDGASAVYGILKPIVVLDQASLGQMEILLTHEFVHIRKQDNLKKIFSRLCLCMHWFNPLIWLVMGQLQRDIETACDETVLMTLGYDERKTYAAAILELAEKHRYYRMNAFASFGHHPVYQRIKHVLNVSERSKAFPVVAAAVVLFLLTGCLSSPITAMEGNYDTDYPAPYYNIKGDFIDLPRPYPDTHDLLDYAVGADRVYFVVADRYGRTGDRLVVKDRENRVLIDQEITVAGSKIASTILLLGERLYYFLEDKDGSIRLLEWKPETDSPKSLYALTGVEMAENIILCGEGDYLTWYEDSDLVIFDCKQFQVIKRIKTNGREHYAMMMDGYVAYQHTDQATGGVIVSRYQPDNDATLATRSLLGTETYSVYANQYYMVYKETFKNGADIIIHDVAQGQSLSLWVLLQASMSQEEIEVYRSGKWGINLLKDKLFLTGVGNKLYSVDLQQGTLLEISGDTSGIGFYQPKNSASRFSALQYGATGKNVYETGSIYSAHVIASPE